MSAGTCVGDVTMATPTGQHHIIKEAGESLGQLLQTVFKESGYKRVHLVVAAPKQEAIEGKLPAVCVYLYNISLDDEGHRLQPHRQYHRDRHRPRRRARAKSRATCRCGSVSTI